MSVSNESDIVRPRLRPGLVIRPAELDGQFVVKDAMHGAYFHIGAQEHFLLQQLDGKRSEAEICAAFAHRFAEPLSAEDFREFFQLASRRKLLQGEAGETREDPADDDADDAEIDGDSPKSAPQRKLSGQKLLYFRWPFFDPDRLLTALEPRLRFVWTWGFVVVSALAILAAATVAFVDRGLWLGNLPQTLTWQMLLGMWFTVFVVSMLHEFAHGLTCKRFGGEVHEIGFLLMYFMPCFYCNVSDAWLFREKWKRMTVGLAGAYCDLCLWAAAIFVWRLTVPESSLNQMAWMVSSVAGGGCFLNFNPLVKLDGYYLLSDYTGIPNLSGRGRRRWFNTLRWLLWGGTPPAAEPQGRFLLVYGLASWFFISSIFLGLVLGFVGLQAGGAINAGYVGIGLSLLMTVVIGRNLFKGFFGREFLKMFAKRHGRVILWALVLLGGPLATLLIPYRERAAGTFRVRPATHAEINALEAGFLRDIQVAEGSLVKPGMVIARIDVPDLEVNLTKKQAEIREAEANLRCLTAGPRPEEIAEQRERVQRGLAWRDLGRSDLEHAKAAFAEELNRLDRKIDQHASELKFCELSVAHAEQLHREKALSGEQLLSEKTKCEVKTLELEEARAQRRARVAQGTVSAEAVLAQREKDLADDKSKLRLLEAGGRPEEIEAERARLARLTEERSYLERIKSRVVLVSPVGGTVTTPRMHEKNGQYLALGTPICVVEELSDMVAEILISEDSEHAVQPGQLVELRARAMPFRSFQATVERKAPSAVIAAGQSQGTVTVYCRLSEADAEILSGMSGYARIYRQSSPWGLAIVWSGLKHLQTEFWWW